MFKKENHRIKAEKIVNSSLGFRLPEGGAQAEQPGNPQALRSWMSLYSLEGGRFWKPRETQNGCKTPAPREF